MARALQSQQDLVNLGEISVKTLQGLACMQTLPFVTQQNWVLFVVQCKCDKKARRISNLIRQNAAAVTYM